MTSQKSWDLPLIIKKQSKIQEYCSNNLTDKALNLGVSTKESGFWLNALPSSCLSNKLDNDSFKISIALRLGSKICEILACRCGGTIDDHGHHGLSCKFNAGRQSRHHTLNEIICRSLSSAGFSSILEPAGTCRVDGMTLRAWKRGKSLVWDVTCVDTLAPSYLNLTSKESGAASKLGEAKKTSKYSTLLDRFIFYPLGFETLGGWGPECKHLINTIGQEITKKTGETRATQYLKQRLSIEIQRGNATSIINLFPKTQSLDHYLTFL
jgi:hypothetical protein